MEILRSSFVVVCKCSSTVHSRRYLITWSLFKMIRSRFISVHYSHNFSRCFMSTIVHNSFNLIVSKWCIFAFNTHILFPTIKESTIYSITPTWRIQTNKSLSHTIHLSANQIRVKVATLQQLLMCSLSHDHTIVNHEDDVTVHNRAQTMRHCHHCTRVILSPRLQRCQELLLILAV